MTKHKPTYEQALGLEKGQAAARAARRRHQHSVSEPTPEENAAWEARYREALKAYQKSKEG